MLHIHIRNAGQDVEEAGGVVDRLRQRLGICDMDVLHIHGGHLVAGVSDRIVRQIDGRVHGDADGIQLLYNPEDGVAPEALEPALLFVNNDRNLDGAERWEDGGPRVLGARGGQ